MAVALRTAILGVGHWHAKYAFSSLAKHSVVAAVSDPISEQADSAAAKLNCRSYTDYRQLLDHEDIDAVFIYGRHIDMGDMVTEVILRRIPFSVEKPAGVSAGDVARLRDSAQAANVFASVPFTHRMTPWVKAIRNDGSSVVHASFRLLSGPPTRYVENAVPWVLEPRYAGGGCTINLSVLFVDLFRHLTGERVALQRAVLSNALHGLPVEDYSNLLLTAASSGAVAIVETGYTFPTSAADVTSSVRTDEAFYRMNNTGFDVNLTTGSARTECHTHHREYYGQYVARTLADIAGSRPPLATLEDLYHAMLIIDEAYATGVRLG